MQTRESAGARDVPHGRAHHRRWTGVATTLGLSGLASVALVLTARTGPATALLDAVCWTLVVGGVAGTCLAGAGVRCGWLILLAMQPVWIAYAVVTGQMGFVLGSLAYAGGQLNGYLRAAPTPRSGPVPEGIARPGDCA